MKKYVFILLFVFSLMFPSISQAAINSQGQYIPDNIYSKYPEATMVGTKEKTILINEKVKINGKDENVFITGDLGLIHVYGNQYYLYYEMHNSGDKIPYSISANYSVNGTNVWYTSHSSVNDAIEANSDGTFGFNPGQHKLGLRGTVTYAGGATTPLNFIKYVNI